jgi:signal transduction histidine kinase
MEAMGLLAGGVAHDFNNMLGVILGYAELALFKVDPAQPVHADLKEIVDAARRSAAIVRQLLAFARKQAIDPKVLDLNDTVEGMLKMLRRLIGEDIDLAWLPGSGLWQVKMDPTQVEQILANLCVNARDAIAGGRSHRRRERCL